jgi:membrane associated rhomboid family serine protease
MGYTFGTPGHRVRIGGPITPVLKKLLIANLVVFAMQVIIYLQVGRPEVSPMAPAYKHLTGFEQLFALTPELAIGKFRVWQFITHGFLHDVGNLMHILFNMLLLWMFGGEVEAAIGSRRFGRLYFAAVLAGGLCMMPWYFIEPDIPILGASAAVFAVLALFARLYPQRRLLVWGIIPVRARTLVLFLAGLDLLFAVSGSRTGTAHLAHLGGFAVGWFYLTFQRAAKQARTQRVGRQQERRERQDAEVRRRVDELLSKVGREGLGSLNAEEREFLKRASQRYRS